MIHLELIDQLFEACPELQFFVFDRRFLLPLAQLPEAVARETGQTISEGELRIRAGQGWFPLLPGAGEDGTEEGSPLYVPSRIGLLLKLQRQGYTTDELRLIAQIEERMIDNAYTTEDLAYVDDDLETIRLHAEARVVALECGTTRNSNGVLLDRTAEIDRARRSVKYVSDASSQWSSGTSSRDCCEAGVSGQSDQRDDQGAALERRSRQDQCRIQSLRLLLHRFLEPGGRV